MRLAVALALAVVGITAPLAAQTSGQPGVQDASRAKAGTYIADLNHTQVTWQVNHMNFTLLEGQLGASAATLVFDPANPSAAKVDVTFDTNKQSVTSEHLNTHLMSKDYFDSAIFPTAHFVSTKVMVKGNKATIVGNLTIKNITKPVTLDATFIGAGTNPNSGKLNIGFRATATVNRSDFGLGLAAPLVSDKVDLTINASFAL